MSYIDLLPEGYNELKAASILTPKSSIRSYKSHFNKSNLIDSIILFQNLSPEPLSVIKSSPKDVTYFGEKKFTTK